MKPVHSVPLLALYFAALILCSVAIPDQINVTMPTAIPTSNLTKVLNASMLSTMRTMLSTMGTTMNNQATINTGTLPWSLLFVLVSFCFSRNSS